MLLAGCDHCFLAVHCTVLSVDNPGYQPKNQLKQIRDTARTLLNARPPAPTPLISDRMDLIEFGMVSGTVNLFRSSNSALERCGVQSAQDPVWSKKYMVIFILLCKKNLDEKYFFIVKKFDFDFF